MAAFKARTPRYTFMSGALLHMNAIRVFVCLCARELCLICYYQKTFKAERTSSTKRECQRVSSRQLNQNSGKSTMHALSANHSSHYLKVLTLAGPPPEPSVWSAVTSEPVTLQKVFAVTERMNCDALPFASRGQPTLLSGWLNVFNAELSPKRYWRGPGSQEVREEGDLTMPNNTLSPAEWPLHLYGQRWEPF